MARSNKHLDSDHISPANREFILEEGIEHYSFRQGPRGCIRIADDCRNVEWHYCGNVVEFEPLTTYSKYRVNLKSACGNYNTLGGALDALDRANGRG